MEKKYWKSRGILSARKSGNPDEEAWMQTPSPSMNADPPPTEWCTGVKTLPYPKLRLQAVEKNELKYYLGWRDDGRKATYGSAGQFHRTLKSQSGIRESRIIMIIYFFRTSVTSFTLFAVPLFIFNSVRKPVDHEAVLLVSLGCWTRWSVQFRAAGVTEI